MPNFVTRFRDRFNDALTLGVRGLVLAEDSRVLLVRHGYTRGWHFPGGGVERGETFNEALARELKEEGNIELIGAPVLHGLYFHPRYSDRDHVALFVVRDFRQEAAPKSNREIVECGFFALSALPPETSTGTRERIAEVLHGQPISERW